MEISFPALHETNFAAYFTGWQILGPEKSILEPKVDSKYRFYELK